MSRGHASNIQHGNEVVVHSETVYKAVFYCYLSRKINMTKFIRKIFEKDRLSESMLNGLALYFWILLILSYLIKNGLP